MPAPRKGARLWFRPERTGADGSIRRGAWFIIDGRKHVSTGCFAGEIECAERQLAAYIAAKHEPARKERPIEAIDVADVLAIYDDDHKLPSEKDQRELTQRVERLALFWGGTLLANVTPHTCRLYAEIKRGRGKAAKRPHTGAARRDLEVLRAAINHHARLGYHRAVVPVWLPQKGVSRDRWLTRGEAARLLWTCWRTREVQTLHRGGDAGRKAATGRYPLRHLARFILIGLYTGTRAGAIASSCPTRGDGHSFVDLEHGVFHRLAEGRRATKKRQPPVRIPGRLLAHLRRWARLDREKAARTGRLTPVHFVEYGGKPVTSVKTGFGRAVDLAGLDPGVIPHTLRHTAATWLMQSGVSSWEAASFLGMTVQMIDRVYGHHHPDHTANAASRIGYRHRARTEATVVAFPTRAEPLAEGLVGPKKESLG